MYADVSHLPDPQTQPEFYDDVTIKRGLAWAIDAVLILALVVPVVVLTAFIGLFFLPVLFFLVGFIYRVATITGGSATWGMRLMAIEFRDAGPPARFRAGLSAHSGIHGVDVGSDHPGRVGHLHVRHRARPGPDRHGARHRGNQSPRLSGWHGWRHSPFSGGLALAGFVVRLLYTRFAPAP